MRIQAVKHLSLAALVAAGLAGQGCANMTATERRVATGAGIGTVTGALISRDVGGAALGGLIGAGAGWLYDREKKRYYYYDSRGRRVYR